MAWHILGGELEMDVIGADVMELLGHDIVRQFGLVAFPAQVGEVKVPEVGRHDMCHGFSGGFVREVPVPAQDALLQCP